MNLRTVFFAIFATIIFSAAAHADDSSALTQKLLAGSGWVNQDGSTMSLAFSSSSQPGVYTVTGNYINNAPNFQCQGTAYPLNGVYYGYTQTISFSVAWSNTHENCESVTGWTGYFVPSSNPTQLQTDWNLAYVSGGALTILQGSDIFTYRTTTASDILTE